jgi:hypothetical protein
MASGGLRSVGLLISDEIVDNFGFCDFCDRVGVATEVMLTETS